MDFETYDLFSKFLKFNAQVKSSTEFLKDLHDPYIVREFSKSLGVARTETIADKLKRVEQTYFSIIPKRVQRDFDLTNSPYDCYVKTMTDPRWNVFNCLKPASKENAHIAVKFISTLVNIAALRANLNAEDADVHIFSATSHDFHEGFEFLLSYREAIVCHGSYTLEYGTPVFVLDEINTIGIYGYKNKTTIFERLDEDDQNNIDVLVNLFDDSYKIRDPKDSYFLFGGFRNPKFFVSNKLLKQVDEGMAWVTLSLKRKNRLPIDLLDFERLGNSSF